MELLLLALFVMVLLSGAYFGVCPRGGMIENV